VFKKENKRIKFNNDCHQNAIADLSLAAELIVEKIHYLMSASASLTGDNCPLGLQFERRIELMNSNFSQVERAKKRILDCEQNFRNCVVTFEKFVTLKDGYTNYKKDNKKEGKKESADDDDEGRRIKHFF
jgi:hypothetical protein